MMPSKYSATEIKTFSDKILDEKYASAFDNKEVMTYTALSMEILDRLQNVRSFITGFFGSVRFPKFDARQSFKQVDAAQESVKENAEKVGDKISSFAMIGGGMIVFIGIVILVLKFKK